MNQIKTLLVAGLVTIGGFSLISYTSCKKDACKDVSCVNGGNCVDGACKCPAGFEGPACETKMNAKFIGTFGAKDKCPVQERSNQELQYDVTIFPDNSSPTKVSVVGIANTPSAYVLSADISADGKKIEIAEQTMANGKTYSGTITATGGGLEASFQVKDDGTLEEACTSTLTKK